MLEKINDLDDSTKEEYRVEIELVKNGTIDLKQLLNIIEKDKDKKKNREKIIMQEKQKRDITSLVELLHKRPELLENIKTFIDYRRLRIEQVLLPDMIEKAENDYENSSFLNIEMMRERVYNLDKQRREKHNKALSNFCGLMREFENFGIPPIYVGEIMDPSKEKDKYGSHYIRGKMTDSMLYILSTIEDININELRIDTEKYDKGLGTFKEIYNNLNKQTHDLGVKKNLTRDDGEIIL